MTQPEMMTPKEFSALLQKRGVQRTARWVRRQVRKGVIRTAPLGGSFLLIPASEADRLLTPTASA
jgi:hypothetical protein